MKALALILLFICYAAPVNAQSTGTWRKFETKTESFETFMRTSPLGDKYNSSMSAIKNVTVRSEAEAILVSSSSGVSLTYTERTIFVPSGFNSITFSAAWSPMQGRYPIEMWTELRERTNDKIRERIKGGNGTGNKHGDVDGDLIWITESGFLGAGAAKGWGLDVTKKYNLGGGATMKCAPDSKSNSFVMTITVPLDNNFNEASPSEVNLSFHSIISGIMKKSKLFGSDNFTMTEVK